MKNKEIYVKICAERGYGNQMFRVCKDKGSEYTLSDSTGKRFDIYKKHCFQDFECRQKGMKII